MKKITVDTISQELGTLSQEQLADVYRYVRSLKMMPKRRTDLKKKILSFAGAFTDMSEEDFGCIQKSIKQTRKELFNREVLV